jgi:hypothetical protein
MGLHPLRGLMSKHTPGTNMANTATVIVLTAGTITFTNEWYQTKKIDWRVPVATVLLAAGFDVMARIDSRGATLLSIMVLVAASTTKFNGKSAVSILSGLGNTTAAKVGKKQ